MPGMSDPVPAATLPPVILVHGFASSSEHNWVRPGWRDALESRGHQVVLMDLPGHGGNTSSGGGLAAVSQLTELAGSFPAVDLVGFSAGARVGLGLSPGRTCRPPCIQPSGENRYRSIRL